VTIVGREDFTGFGPDQREEHRWIGKPWRRVELVRNLVFYRGELIDVGRTLSIHLAIRRLGLALSLTLVRQSALDYSEEPQ
jgi:hypothetical protein